MTRLVPALVLLCAGAIAENPRTLAIRNAKIVTVSIGAGHLVPAPQASPEQLLKSAQRALDKAREAGRNRVALDE